MSSITFNARNDSASVRGPERAMMSIMCANLVQDALRRVPPEQIVAKGNPEHYVYWAAAAVLAVPPPASAYEERAKLERQMDTLARVGDDTGPRALFPNHNLFEMQLNTVNLLGSAIMRLSARIHGQCEIHLWIPGEYTTHIADVIAGAREAGVYRADMGWEGVIDLLRKPDVGDVVLSYSVTDSFPNDHIALSDKLPPAGDWKTKRYEQMTEEERAVQSGLDEARYEVWNEQMTDDERWDAAMAGLKAKGDGYQLLPGRLHDGCFYFGDGQTLFDLARPDEETAA